MSVFLALVRRELGTFFKSLTGYVLIAGVLFMLGLSLVVVVSRLNADAYPVPVTELFYQSAYFWQILILSTPIITMRSFAAEKSSGTYEALMTAPVGDWQVVLAKFTGAWLFYLLTWLPLAGMLFVLRQISHEPALFEPRLVASTYLGLALVGMLYVSLGIFASALTRSQIIAAMVSFLLGVGLWMLSQQAQVGSLVTAPGARFFEYVSMLRHVDDFARGLVETGPIVYYLTLSGFFLFATHRVVESRRWK